MTNSAPKRVVYTALFGGYEDLLEQPAAAASGVPFICFTDDPHLTSKSWKIRVVEPRFPADLQRSARTIKIVGHESLAGYDELLYIDNTVKLKVDPAALLDTWLRDQDFALAAHSYRRHVVDEFDIVIRQGLDDPARVLEQLTHYGADAEKALLEPPLWAAILARRATPHVAATMRLWLDHVLRYSRRDQLSIVIALASTALPFSAIDIDNRDSEWHEWPVASGRRAASPTSTALTMFPAPPIARIGHLSNELDEVTWRLNHAVKEREAEVVLLREERDAKASELAALLGSRAWRLAALVGRASSLVRCSRH